MSDRAGRAVTLSEGDCMFDGGAWRTESIIAASAEREARAILAETEPESRCPEAVTTRYDLTTLARSVRHPGIAFTLPHDIQAALAEALAGFVVEGN